jgi:hypothetical protein
MFSTLGRTWDLTKQSFGVLRDDKALVLFPIISAISAIAVSATFLVALVGSGVLEMLARQRGETGAYLILFIFYYINYFVIIFFNSALVACASLRLGGGSPTVSDGLRVATMRLGRIAMWALVASTVGLILQIIENRAEKVGRIIAGLLGMAWTLITYFVVPVIVFEDSGMVDSVKRSAQLVRQHWGEEVVSGFSFGLLGFLLALPGIFLAMLLFSVYPGAAIVLLVVYLLALSAVMAAVKGIFLTALYRYATQGKTPERYFVSASFENAFAPR